MTTLTIVNKFCAYNDFMPTEYANQWLKEYIFPQKEVSNELSTNNSKTYCGN